MQTGVITGNGNSMPMSGPALNSPGKSNTLFPLNPWNRYKIVKMLIPGKAGSWGHGLVTLPSLLL